MSRKFGLKLFLKLWFNITRFDDKSLELTIVHLVIETMDYGFCKLISYDLYIVRIQIYTRWMEYIELISGSYTTQSWNAVTATSKLHVVILA